MKEEIAAGIRNALERGSSVEEAIQSFINAGYNSDEVRQAADLVMHGATSIISPTENSAGNPPVNAESNQTVIIPEPKKSGKLKAILLITTLVILLGALGVSLFYKDAILELINSFYG